MRKAPNFKQVKEILSMDKNNSEYHVAKIKFFTLKNCLLEQMSYVKECILMEKEFDPCYLVYPSDLAKLAKLRSNLNLLTLFQTGE